MARKPVDHGGRLVRLLTETFGVSIQQAFGQRLCKHVIAGTEIEARQRFSVHGRVRLAAGKRLLKAIQGHQPFLWRPLSLGEARQQAKQGCRQSQCHLPLHKGASDLIQRTARARELRV